MPESDGVRPAPSEQGEAGEAKSPENQVRRLMERESLRHISTELAVRPWTSSSAVASRQEWDWPSPPERETPYIEEVSDGSPPTPDSAGRHASATSGEEEPPWMTPRQERPSSWIWAEQRLLEPVPELATARPPPSREDLLAIAPCTARATPAPTGPSYGVAALDPARFAHHGAVTVFPCVLSIGYNPFYKNTLKSIEVHIMRPLDDQPTPPPSSAPPSSASSSSEETQPPATATFFKLPDFYSTPMNLLILGYIRPEFDYVSREALIDDIKTDCDVAVRSLKRPAYRPYFEEAVRTAGFQGAAPEGERL
ncbi:riboflavin kinase [Ascosphaera acerosa]|nr:riboflavin kinase [Ascosphaera acerosa]